MRRRFLVNLVCAGGLMLPVSGAFAQGTARQTAEPLEGTQWNLRWVEGATVEGGSPRPAYIELDRASHKLSGSGGCNRLMGGYELEGDHLRLTGTARTMMACAGGMDVEDKLVKALEDVREWKVSGERLELLDGSEKVVARFSAGNGR